MLELTRHIMKIGHLNVRTELHGDDEVTAVDIRLQFDVPNHVLNQLAPDCAKRCSKKRPIPTCSGRTQSISRT
jgi:hypothetical protein